MSTPLPGEFELIRRLTARLPAAQGVGVVGIGDDCAALPDGAAGGSAVLLLTCDIAVAGRHFTPGLTPMRDVGWRIATANVSDVCACGGLPDSALVSLGLPADTPAEEIDALYDGLAEAAEAYGFRVLGGNVSGAEQMLVDVFMLGRAPAFIARSGAQPGDVVAVSGCLGGAAAGLRALQAHDPSAAGRALAARHLRPRARTDLVPLLQEVATAAIDISDGLAAELNHLAAHSGIALEIQSERIPLAPELPAWAAAHGEQALQIALHSGEEYALLFTLPRAALPRLEGTDVTVIGQVTLGRNAAEQRVRIDGIDLAPQGWDHLKRSG